MKKHRPTLLLVSCMVVILVLVLLWRNETPTPDEKLAEPTKSENQPEETEELHPHLTGFLKDYASPTLPPENDLILIGDLLHLFQTTLKQADSLPTSGNAEIVKALQGENAYREVFLPESFQYLDKEARLLDRWHTPFYFHFVSAKSPEIRSAGPDKIHWTEDDLSKLP